jgi:mRNA interferase HigB
MRLIKPSALTAFARRHPDAAPALLHWFEIARRAGWQNLTDTRRDFPHADQVRVASLRPVTVFNLGGGKFRLLTAIHYDRQRIFLLDFLTHAEYSKPRWKTRL